MELNRRDFLKAAGGFGLVLGLPSTLLGQDPEPEWFGKALARMKRENKPGVALAVPKDPQARRSLSRNLLALVQTENTDVRMILAEAVFVGLGAKEFDRIGRDGETAVLIDTEGRRIEGIAFGAFDQAPKFVEAFAKLLHGAGDARLNERADAILQAAPADVRQALADLAVDDLETADRAEAVLHRHAAAIVPLLVRESRKKPRARAVVLRYFADLSEKEPGRLPYGVRVGEHYGCTEDSQAKCGRSSVPSHGRKFLEFLSS